MVKNTRPIKPMDKSTKKQNQKHYFTTAKEAEEVKIFLKKLKKKKIKRIN